MAEKKLTEVDVSTTMADTDKVVGNIGSAVKQITLANLVTIIKNKIGSLKNPNALTFTGAVNETYDGSETKTVDIPDLSPYQTKTDNTLTTTSKEIVGAINENKTNISKLSDEKADKVEVSELKGDISELQSIGFYIDEEGYLCQNIKEDM